LWFQLHELKIHPDISSYKRLKIAKGESRRTDTTMKKEKEQKDTSFSRFYFFYINDLLQ
jgi:hypothetical protein